MNKKIEILAPAGSYDGMRAAMNAGCDAVYIGGSSFGARAYANNLDEDTLLRAIDEAHIRDKRLYLTVNTLLKEKELTLGLYKFLYRFYEQGLDAVIVQDVGVMNFIHENFPELPIHASTQMTLTMAQGANLLKESGVTRLVTSRELSLKEIKLIRQDTDLEIETFVHGALCYCYSGQCLMSSIIGGRSGNRGRCAQPCRMPYQFYSENQKISKDKEKYLLSPKDINTITIIPDLVDAGINSFKIEGRMKRPEYAAAVAYLYRKYVDIYLAYGRKEYQKLLEGDELKKDMLMLQDVYNRGGFSEGYWKTYHGKAMMSLYRPNHSGVYVGEVKEIKGSQVSIMVKEPIHAQDILEIRSNEEDGYEFTVKDAHKPGDILRTNIGVRPAKQEKGSKKNKKAGTQTSFIKVGINVYRTKNNQLLEQLEKDYIAQDKKLGIKGHLEARLGKRLSLTVTYRECTVTAYRELVQEAMKQPMTVEKLKAPLEKTGDTLYYFEELQIEADDNIFVPVAWLNDIRREAILLLQQEVVGQYRRVVKDDVAEKEEQGDKEATNLIYSANTFKNLTMDQRIGICASFQTREQYQILLHTPEVEVLYADYEAFSSTDLCNMAKESCSLGKRFFIALPHICRSAVYERLKKDLYGIIDKEEISGFLVKNFEEISLLKSLGIDEKQGKELVLNSNMYTMNSQAKIFWKKKGISHFCTPLELNYQELKQLGIHDSDMIVYGYLPLMISAQCLFESTQGCKQKKLDHKDKGAKAKQGFQGQMTDRLGKSFYVSTNCRSCYNVIYNGQVLALYKQANEIKGLHPRNIRLDFTMESEAQTRQVVTLFVDCYYYDKETSMEIPEYTTGHFKRGIE